MTKFYEAHIPIIGNVRVNFYDICFELFEIYEKCHEFERQNRINHLGLISYAFPGVNHTRFEYLILQCVISELVENNFKGTTSAQGSLKLNNTTYSGNAIIKTWAMLSNFGHAFYTIGDERALLLLCYDRKSFKNELLNTIKDEQLKKWSNEKIENLDYVNFHHILSIVRLYKQRNSTTKRQVLIDLYKLLLLDIKEIKFLIDRAKLSLLKNIYKNIRELSIVALDSRNSHLPVTIDILTAILSYDFYENRFSKQNIGIFLKPYITLLYDEIYLNKKAQTIQRDYEINALELVKGKKFNNIFKTVFDKGLADPTERSLRHFARYTSFQDDNQLLLEEFRTLVFTVTKAAKNVEASIDYNPLTKRKVVDFYIQKNFQLQQLAPFTFTICQILENHINQTIQHEFKNSLELIKEVSKNLAYEGVNHEIILRSMENVSSMVPAISSRVNSENTPNFRELLWSILKFFIKDEYYFDIDHHYQTNYDFFGFRLANNRIDSLTNQIVAAIKHEDNNDRIHELKQLQNACKRSKDCFTLACLVRLNIYDYSQSPDKRKVTDIDSVLVKIKSDSLILELHESKNTSKSVRDAKRDINNMLLKTLIKENIKGYRITGVKGMGAKLIIKH